MMSSASSSGARTTAAVEVPATDHSEKMEKRSCMIEEDAAKKQEAENVKGSINTKNTEMKRKQEEGIFNIVLTAGTCIAVLEKVLIATHWGQMKMMDIKLTEEEKLKAQM